MTGPHWLVVLQGSKGRKGFRGEKGVKGRRGARGEKGERGIAGEPGQTGDPGQRGHTGLRGEQGARGKPGARGMTGLKGSHGPTGRLGHPGAAGQPGLNGERGLRGQVYVLSGLQGDTGSPGPPAKCNCSQVQSPERLLDGLPTIFIADGERQMRRLRGENVMVLRKDRKALYIYTDSQWIDALVTAAGEPLGFAGAF
ncbi:uncharacterized protein V6R79_001629 [Siganus canaliculatus]